MEIVICLSCGTKMVPMSNGNCPSCAKAWNAEVAKVPNDQLDKPMESVPMSVKVLKFINSKAIIMAVFGLMAIVAGFFGFEIGRRGHVMSVSDTLPIGGSLIIIGLLLYFVTKLMLAKHNAISK